MPILSIRRAMRRLPCTVLLAAFAVTAVPAEAASRGHRKTHQSRVQPSGSDEKPAERDRRLRRECKGRPNAGACLGYTQ